PRRGVRRAPFRRPLHVRATAGHKGNRAGTSRASTGLWLRNRPAPKLHAQRVRESQGRRGGGCRKVLPDASDTGPGRRGRGTRRRAQHWRRAATSRSSPEYGASCGTFLVLSAGGGAFEVAEQGIAIFFGPIGQVLDKVFDLLAGSLAEGLNAEKVG